MPYTQRQLEKVAGMIGGSTLAAKDWLDKGKRQDAYRRQEMQSRTKGNPMKNAQHTINNGSRELARLTLEFARARKEAAVDPYLPPAGRLARQAELEDEYTEKHAEAVGNIETAIAVEKARLRSARDAQRPDVDPVTWDRRLRRFEKLLAVGVPLVALVHENAGDPVGLRILEDEIPTLARVYGEADAKDPEAGSGLDALLKQAGYDAYGDGYRRHADDLKDLDRKAQFLANAIGGTRRALTEPGHNPNAILDVSGEVIDLDTDAA